MINLSPLILSNLFYIFQSILDGHVDGPADIDYRTS